MSLSQRFARFIVDLDLDNIPSEVIEKSRCCVLNGYGIALGSHTTSFFPVAAKAVLSMDGVCEQGATLLTDGRKSTVAGAALANAALFHGRAQEDTCGVAHFGAILLPLLTALIESGEGQGKDFLPALISGYEVGGALESEYSPLTTGVGLRASPLYGTIAAAAAVAKLWHLSVDQTAAALANAASFTGGILQSFGEGTDEWRYQVGMAARNGLAAASLARAGSVSATNAFEGRSGFVRAFVREDADIDAITAKLGQEWSVLKVTFKPYPVCALNQTPVTTALDMRERLMGHEINAVRVHLNPTVVGYAGMDSEGPFHSISGTLMSIQFCIASTLLYGMPTVARMGDFDNKAIKSLISRIKPIADPELGLLACRIEVDINGETVTLERQADHTDYSYDRAKVSELIRSIGEEVGVPSISYDQLEKFVEMLPNSDFSEVIEAFKEIQKPVQGVDKRPA